MMQTYATIILPLAVDQTYTYEVPTELQATVEIGKRVEVQFGKKRIYAGIVKSIYESEPPEHAMKAIRNVLDDQPILLPKHLQFWKWMSTYYMCSEGSVMQAGLPSGFKLSSETKLVKNPSFNEDFSLLTDEEYLIAEALSVQGEIELKDVEKILNKKNVFAILKSLIDKGVAFNKEELKERFKPKTAKFIQLAPEYQDEEKLKEAFDSLSRAHKQLAVLMAYIHITKTEQKEAITKKYLLTKAKATASHVKPLVTKGILQEVERVVSRLEEEKSLDIELFQLSPHQRAGFLSIKKQFEDKSTVLLYGITSSGKTQVYMDLMEEVINNGQQVLYLLPEIALTAQMIARLRKVFGNVGVYHSKFSHQERIEIWHKVLQKDYKIVIGARSALFLPFTDLGLVIVDEEHDSSFKQTSPAPRYHARDTAIYLAALHGAKTLLGSATPSLESYYNATILKKYGLVELTERFGGVEPPEIQVVNIRGEMRKDRMKSHFTQTLLDEVKGALDDGEQAIIFQNRRGYSPYLICRTCGWIPDCYQCDVSLTYHKYSNRLQCHYCDHDVANPAQCEACGSTDMQIQGFGTEKIEDELGIYFPEAKIGRLDLEVTKTKTGAAKIIKSFQDNKVQILVGTQMVTKGLDFDNVRVVGVLSADQLVNFPNFRAVERAFQLMLQVSGRAGRRKKQGKVIIQTMNSSYRILPQIVTSNYQNFFDQELNERSSYNYPPFMRLVQLTLKNKDSGKVNRAAFELTKQLQSRLAKNVLGPSVPPVSRIRGYYLRRILIKLDKSVKSIRQWKPFIQQTIRQLKLHSSYKSVIVQIDVDP